MDITGSVFDRIDSAPVADLVVRQIEDMIVQGILAEGARLPSERDLAARLDISRPKVRDALKALEEMGLLTIRHGEGTFVAQLTGQAMQPALIDLYARHGRAFQDYLEYRRAQEGFAAALAATRATPTDRTVIARHLEALEQAEDDPDASREADVLFHSAIVQASHNTMLIHMMASIYDLTRRGVFYNRRYLRTLDGTGARLLQQHRDIAAAVLGGDPEAARTAAEAHLDFVELSFRKGQEMRENELMAQKRDRASRA
ncbi:MAG: FadR/GntR family transcriptional regulator [Pseudomonadota bacterium]